MARTLGVTFAIGASVNPSVASAFATVEQKMRASQARMRELSDKARVLAAAETAKARVVETQRLFAASGGRDPMLREALARELSAFNKAAAAAGKYGVAIADISRAHERANRELALTESRLQSFQKAQAWKEKRQEAASSIRAAAVPALAVAAPIKDAIEFESAMASAAKTIDGMRDDNGRLTAQFYEMEAAIKQMGQTLPLTHDELAKLFAAGGQQGMSDVAELREFTTMAAQMATAFDMTTEAAADSIGGYRSALNLTMPEARSLLDLMNQFANTTSASEKGIADVVRRVGSLGSVGGVAAKPVTALAATLDAMKVAPEVAATGIKNLILAMTAGSAATKSQKAAFASLGISTVKLAKQMQIDGPAAIISVLEAVKKLPKAQQLSTMQQIFGKESLGSIAPLLANLDKVRENLALCADETRYAGAMQKEFDNVSGTTANKLILFKNRVQEVGITVAGALLPAIQSITEAIGPPISAVARFAGEHRGLTTAAIGVAASLVGLKVGVAAVTWIASGIGGAFNLAKAGILGFSVAARAAAAVQAGFNAVMAASPVGIVVTAVAALVGGLVYLYKTCEPVRAVFDAVFTFIGDTISRVTDKIRAVATGFKTVARYFGFGGDDEPEASADTPKPVAVSPKAASAPEFDQLQYAWGMPTPPAPEPPDAPITTQAKSAAPANESVVAQAGPVAAKTESTEAGGVQPAQRPQTAPSQQPIAPSFPPAPIPVAARTALPDSEPAAPATVIKKEAQSKPEAASPDSETGTKPETSDTRAPRKDSRNTANPVPAPSQQSQPDIEALIRQIAAAQSEKTEAAKPLAAPQPQIVQPQVQVAINVTQNGIPDQTFATGVMNAIKSRQSEFEGIISALVNEQARLAYGG